MPPLVKLRSERDQMSAIESATILSMWSTEMVMSVVITGSPPPSIWYNGAPWSWPHRS